MNWFLQCPFSYNNEYYIICYEIREIRQELPIKLTKGEASFNKIILVDIQQVKCDLQQESSAWRTADYYVIVQHPERSSR